MKDLTQLAAQFAESMGDLQVPAGGSLVASGYAENDQGSERQAAWNAVHNGRITGSQFHRAKLNAKGDGLGVGAVTWVNEIIWEWLTGLPASDFESSKATDWGLEHEAEAIRLYEKATRRKGVRGKFFHLKGSDLIGCTPDAVGRGYGLEVKCPHTGKNHVRTLVSGKVPEEYMDQVDGHMWITGKAQCDFVSYDPRPKEERHRLVIVTVERNEMRIADLESRVMMVEAAVIEGLEKLGINYKKRKR